MKAEVRERLVQLRGAVSRGEELRPADVRFLLETIESLDRELGLARASASTYRDFGDAEEEAHAREVAELHGKLLVAEDVIRELKRARGAGSA
jgi:hypothetical protein